ncbi:MAG: hypothetical protein IJH55_10375, partial [Romboutsia sp.]|nr:hypothetical protein [Romboutsia sp.]
MHKRLLAIIISTFILTTGCSTNDVISEHLKETLEGKYGKDWEDKLEKQYGEDWEDKLESKYGEDLEDKLDDEISRIYKGKLDLIDND